MFAAIDAVGAATSTFRALSLLAAAIAVSIAQPVASSSSHQSTAPDYAREKVPVTPLPLNASLTSFQAALEEGFPQLAAGRYVCHQVA